MSTDTYRASLTDQRPSCHSARRHGDRPRSAEEVTLATEAVGEGKRRIEEVEDRGRGGGGG